jgi:hypothetical protein
MAFKTQDMDEHTMAQVWHLVLNDIDYEDAKASFIVYARQNHFPPTPSDIILNIAKNKDPELFMSGEEAWAIVSENCMRYGFNGQSEAYKQFSSRMKEAIKLSGGWWAHCYTERIEQVKNNFIKAWNIKAEPQREENLLPVGFLQKLQNHMKQGELNDPQQLPKV